MAETSRTNIDFEGTGGGSPDRNAGASGAGERGKRATYDPSSGEVHGSGSGAGPAGERAEDYDGDPMAGGTREPAGDARPAGRGAERPVDPDEGV